MKKFELSTEHKINWLGRTLYRIKACISFTTASGEEIKAGDIIGDVAVEAGGENPSLLFQLYREKTILDPSDWLKL